MPGHPVYTKTPCIYREGHPVYTGTLCIYCDTLYPMDSLVIYNIQDTIYLLEDSVYWDTLYIGTRSIYFTTPCMYTGISYILKL